MKRVLIFSNNEELDRRVLQPTNYDNIILDLKQQGGGNSGNKLFTFAIEKYLTSPSITYDHYNSNMSAAVINEKYDLIVLPMANILNPNPIVLKEMENYADFFSDIRIPIYPIGIGAQADSYDNIKEVSQLIKKSATRFLRAVYDSGGEFALRGYFTKEIFDLLGFKDKGVVTGCPSLYMKGRNLNIKNIKVTKQEFKPLFNGDIQYLQKEGILHYFDEFPESVLMDQNEFADLLYSKERNDFLGMSKMGIFDLIKRYTLTGLSLAANNRVKLIYDVPIWLEYLEKQMFNFSFGSRIHGNLAAILSGIPAMVLVRDSRTRELAEFFNIPHISHVPKKQSLYSLYENISFDKFNKEYPQKFDCFQNFLRDNHIVDDIENDSYFNEKLRKVQFSNPKVVKNLNLEKINSHIESQIGLYKIIDCVIKNKRILKDKLNKF